MRKQRGLSFIELLVAIIILGLALAGLIGLWTFGYNATRRSQDIAAGYNIARREIERQRNIGFEIAPEATITQGYDGAGAPVTEYPHFVAVSTMHTLPDVTGQINITCLRRLDVQVTATDRNEVVFSTATYFTRGGI